MPVTIYRSSDGSAPALTGQTGSLVTVLDAVLVNGYGAKAAAGWTKAFSGSSKAAYQMGGGNQFYLRVQDDGPGAASFREARLRGYQTMSDVDTGTLLFPTSAELAAGIIVRKSTSLDATGRTWLIAADNRCFHLFVVTGDSSTDWFVFTFGGFRSLIPSDAFRTMIHGRTTENSGVNSQENWASLQSSLNVPVSGLYLAGSVSGIGGSVNVAKCGRGNGFAGNATIGNNASASIPYPNTADAAPYVVPIVLGASDGSLRGRVLGMWNWAHSPTAEPDQTVLTGAGDLAGKSFLFLRSNFGGSGSAYVLETSDTWEADI